MVRVRILLLLWSLREIRARSCSCARYVSPSFFSFGAEVRRRLLTMTPHPLKWQVTP